MNAADWLMQAMKYGVMNAQMKQTLRPKIESYRYTSKNLSGLRVEHSIEEFKEGQQVILTLKDKKIINDKKDDEDDDNDNDEDVLINVNIADNETAKERAELAKKKTPGYRAYNEDETVDQFGMLNPNKLLEQYDDKKKSSFRLESDGAYDMSDEKVMDAMKQEIRARMQSLAVPTPKVASEFYTAAELEQFKKPKKVTKNKLRSRKMLKADDLLAMDSSEPRESSSTTTSVSLRPAETRRPTAIVSTSKERPATISLDKVKRKIITTTATEDGEFFDANKTLDLDFYVPTTKSFNEDEQTTTPSSTQGTDSPIIQRQQQKQQSNSIPIKTMDLFPGSTTILNDDAKRIIDSLPNLNFMSAKALMFPIRFNANNNDESTTLY
ncbi:unnamed protein product [Rotaria sp. Silwood1]|nr:unnamed protein product [Rotaria sp. Silwood1]